MPPTPTSGTLLPCSSNVTVLPTPALVAAQRADEYKAKGDDDGYEIWKAIVEAVLEVMRGAPEGDERVN